LKPRHMQLTDGRKTYRPRQQAPALDSNLCRAVLRVIEQHPGISSSEMAAVLKSAVNIRRDRSKLALHTLLLAGRIRRDQERSAYYINKEERQ